MSKSIKGIVTYQNIETGFWGIIDEDGEKWLIVNMPEQLKFDELEVTVTIEPINAMSLAIWGTPALITSFSTY